MSKLYSKYSELKKKNSNTVYLFKSGIFYLALEEDATVLSSNLNLKITNLNETVTKCGFPVSRLSHYVSILNAKNIVFEIVDSTYGTIQNYADYVANTQLKEIVDLILEIDFNNITFKESFEILQKTQQDLKKIYSS